MTRVSMWSKDHAAHCSAGAVDPSMICDRRVTCSYASDRSGTKPGGPLGPAMYRVHLAGDDPGKSEGSQDVSDCQAVPSVICVFAAVAVESQRVV